MKTIFNTYIKIESQKEADRLKQVCIYNGLEIWNDSAAFLFFDEEVFGYSETEFFVFDLLNNDEELTEVTESEWMELLKEYKS